MKKTRISETQIIRTLNEHESGTSTEIICREYGISRATLYLWKMKYFGADVSQLKRLKDLEGKISVIRICMQNFQYITRYLRRSFKKSSKIQS